jgi:hypothetical protein
MNSAIWLQLPDETGEAYAAFRLFYQTFQHDIHRAWHRFAFPLSSLPPPDSSQHPAPPHWHQWRVEHRWDERALAAEVEERRLEQIEAQKQEGNALCWSAERREDFRDLLAIYRNLRKSLVLLTESGELRNVVRKTVAKVGEAWQTTEETICGVEQLKFVERTRTVLFPPDNSKPLLPDGGSLFLDLDTLAEPITVAPPPRD